mmetsp:Transcript_20975/g.37495  ORF Transcript_20975/g.37495 Transcript_20975/m.37495 type:complete len:113 (+) Transcript_20975:3074-3412(+)
MRGVSPCPDERSTYPGGNTKRVQGQGAGGHCSAVLVDHRFAVDFMVCDATKSAPRYLGTPLTLAMSPVDKAIQKMVEETKDTPSSTSDNPALLLLPRQPLMTVPERQSACLS